MNHVLESLPDLVVGFLTDAEAADVLAHIADCGECQAEHVALQDAMHALPLALEDIEAPLALRASILDAVATGPARFAPMLDRLGALFDVVADTARDYVGRLTDPDGWVDLLPGITFLDLVGGPAAAGGRVGLVKMDRGARFPVHRHVGVERVLVLQGGIRDASGDEAQAGDLVEMPSGSEHWFEALGDEGLVYAVVVQDVEILGPPPLD